MRGLFGLGPPFLPKIDTPRAAVAIVIIKLGYVYALVCVYVVLLALSATK